MQAHQNHCNF